MVVPGSRPGAPRGRGRGPRQGVHEFGAEWRFAGCSMCLGHEPRPARAGRALRLHVQPQLRGPAGQGRPHPPGVAARGRGHRGARHALQPVGPRGMRTRTASKRRPRRRERLASWGTALMEKISVVYRHRGAAHAAPTSTPTRSSPPCSSSASPRPASRTRCSTPGARIRSSSSTSPRTRAPTRPRRRRRTSAPAPAASTPSGRCATSASSVVLSPRFADIFRGNAGKQGLLTGQITRRGRRDAVGGHRGQAGHQRRPSTSLPRRRPSGTLTVPFEIDDYTRWRLARGAGRHRADPAQRGRDHEIRGPQRELAAADTTRATGSG